MRAATAKNHLWPHVQHQTRITGFWSNAQTSIRQPDIVPRSPVQCHRGQTLCRLRGDQTHGDASWWKRENGALAGECVPCLQGACQHWWELNLCEVVSKPTGGGWTIGEKGYAGWFHSQKDNAATTFDSKLFKGIFVSVFANPNRITDFNGQTLGRFDTQQLLDWLSSCYSPGCLCYCQRGPDRSEDGYFSITLLTPHTHTPPPLPNTQVHLHLLPTSSERCISLLIFRHLAKAGWTSAWLGSNITQHGQCSYW